jgi:hypothetical protein
MMLVEQNVRALAERHLAEANIDFGSVPIAPRLGDECLETANDRRQAKLPHYEVASTRAVTFARAIRLDGQNHAGAAVTCSAMSSAAGTLVHHLMSNRTTTRPRMAAPPYCAAHAEGCRKDLVDGRSDAFDVRNMPPLMYHWGATSAAVSQCPRI